MVPVANSMVYLRPLYVSPTTNPQPQLQYVVAVLGKNVQIDTSLSSVLSDLLGTTVSVPSGSGTPSTGVVPAQVAADLAAAQTDYQNALTALKNNNLGTYQSDIQAMQQAISQAQQVLPTGSGTTAGATTTTTAPPGKAGKTAKSTTTTSTTPAVGGSRGSTTTTAPAVSGSRGSTTTTTLASAAPVSH
jgi:hypothetical protein